MDQSGQQNQDSKYKDLKHDGLIQQYIRPLLIDGANSTSNAICQQIVSQTQSYLTPVPAAKNIKLRLIRHRKRIKTTDPPEKQLLPTQTQRIQTKKITKYRKMDSHSLRNRAIKKLMHEMRRILYFTYAASYRKLVRKKGIYQLLGCDFLVGKDLRPYLLQVNTNPALFTDNQVQKEIIPPVVKDSLDQTYITDIEATPEKYGFQLIYNYKSKLAYNSEAEKQGICVKQGALTLSTQDKAPIKLATYLYAAQNTKGVILFQSIGNHMGDYGQYWQVFSQQWVYFCCLCSERPWQI